MRVFAVAYREHSWKKPERWLQEAEVASIEELIADGTTSDAPAPRDERAMATYARSLFADAAGAPSKPGERAASRKSVPLKRRAAPGYSMLATLNQEFAGSRPAMYSTTRRRTGDPFVTPRRLRASERSPSPLPGRRCGYALTPTGISRQPAETLEGASNIATTKRGAFNEMSPSIHEC